MPDETLQNVTENGGDFRWTARRSQAASLLAADELTDEEIATACGVTRQTIWRWRAVPAFSAEVAKLAEEMGEAATRYAIGRKLRRVKSLDDRHRRMEAVIQERGADPSMQAVPGGKTGLLCHNVKGVGKGDDFQLIDLYEVDTGLLRELREHEKQAAQELDQWAEKHELTGKGGVPLEARVSGVLLNYAQFFGLVNDGGNAQTASAPGDGPGESLDSPGADL